jgi:hypothetical protein
MEITEHMLETGEWTENFDDMASAACLLDTSSSVSLRRCRRGYARPAGTQFQYEYWW